MPETDPILRLAAQHRIPRPALDGYCLTTYGKRFEQLTPEMRAHLGAQLLAGHLGPVALPVRLRQATPTEPPF